MRIGNNTVKEWDGYGWHLRHEPTGLKAYLGPQPPSDEKIQQQYRSLIARVEEVEKLNDQR